MNHSEMQAADQRAKKFTFTNALGLSKLNLGAHHEKAHFHGTEYRVTFSINI
jgi:hypothetical protein